MHIFICVRAYMHAFIHTCIRSHIHTYMHIHTYKYIHIFMHAHTNEYYTHRHVWGLQNSHTWAIVFALLRQELPSPSQTPHTSKNALQRPVRLHESVWQKETGGIVLLFEGCEFIFDTVRCLWNTDANANSRHECFNIGHSLSSRACLADTCPLHSPRQSFCTWAVMVDETSVSSPVALQTSASVSV